MADYIEKLFKSAGFSFLAPSDKELTEKLPDIASRNPTVFAGVDVFYVVISINFKRWLLPQNYNLNYAEIKALMESDNLKRKST
ncbi:unnamed protein product [Blepharisma stoltei]|uniref:Uncharacterized protein n=1 Tax=Blepharisma stoltei TaxID=1481888 RepID=A0AAU9JHY3_9CILI|nr:unnamed protein product [Blepharisma stoltei]